MKVINLFEKIAKNEDVKDFTVDNGNVVYGVIDGIIIDRTNKKISRWNINDKWLNSEVHFVEGKKDKTEIIECLFNLITDIIGEDE